MPPRSRFIAALERNQRTLPNWEDVGAAYFIRFSLQRPPAVGLSAPSIAEIVVQALHHGDGQRYLLFDYVIMPDHVHVILRPLTQAGQSERLATILQDLKHWLARAINLQVGRRGALWQVESYDHILRNHEGYVEKASYLFENPLRAGLVTDPADWPWRGRG